MNNLSNIGQIDQSAKTLLNEQEAADLLSVAQGTLSVWRSTGRYKIPFIKVGRNIRYRRDALEAWLAARTRDSGATA